MNNDEIIKELKDIISNLEQMSNEADNEDPNLIFIQEVDSAIGCLKLAVGEIEKAPK